MCLRLSHLPSVGKCDVAALPPKLRELRLGVRKPVCRLDREEDDGIDADFGVDGNGSPSKPFPAAVAAAAAAAAALAAARLAKLLLLFAADTLIELLLRSLGDIPGRLVNLSS